MSPSPPSVTAAVRVVVLNWNAAWLTARCVRSLQATDYPAERLEIVVVDNASIDGSLARLRADLPGVTFVANEHNYGFAEGNNRALRDLAGVDYVALINNDAVVSPGWLRPLVAALDAEPDVGAAAPKMLLESEFATVRLRGCGTLTGIEVDGVERTVTWSISSVPLSQTETSRPWLQAFEATLSRSTIPTGLHWVRVTHIQLDRNPIVWEVLLDNKPWEFGQESLHDAPWPSRDGYASERLFAMLQGGVDVSRAVARMIEAAGAPDKDIQPVLMADGATAREAQALLAFVPLAFGRMVLQSLPVHFSETALVRNDRGQQGTEILLSDDPIFARAQDLAADAWQATTFTQDEFLAVAMRSAEVHAVNQAIEQGAQACDLIVSPPTITLSPDDTASP
ncbi:MAG TPA: DUF6348 family protein [Polyangiaceae bacterium]|nr:DUF6348 family protein [Polyangiaceae bacterium]